MRTPSHATHFSLFFIALFLLTMFIRCTEEDLMVQPDTALDSVKVTAQSVLACSSCTYVIPANRTTIDGKALGIKPGDVICLSSGIKYNMLSFQNIIGTASNPVVIRNCGGTANVSAPDKPYAIRFLNSRFLRITGGDTKNVYGIKINGSLKNGLVMGQLTSDFVVDHLEVYNVGFAGIMAKTDPTCDDATIRGNFTMRNVSIHDNYVHHTEGEGFYIGHSSYEGANTSCGTRLPHTIENIKIYGNIIRYSGWDGLQISSATKNVAIYNNLIENYATLNKGGHNHGLQLGGGTVGVCYNNTIRNGSGAGMAVFGMADNLIHNNLIINPGNAGIFCDERTALLGSGYKFVNNTIINPKTFGITLYSERSKNFVINNVIINPGSTAAGELAYISLLSKTMYLVRKNNFLTRNINDLKFVNVSAGNYRLTSGSPARDKGADISNYKIAKDYYNTARLKGPQYDIGASEY